MTAFFKADALFDLVPDTVFFLKDALGRYTEVNQTLVSRCGLTSKAQLIGKTAQEIFPSELGAGFLLQDQAILNGSGPIVGQLELHLYPNRTQGWCLTWKVALLSPDAKVVGLAGLSRDIAQLVVSIPKPDALSKVLEYVRANLDAPLKLDDLAAKAKLSVFQFDQRIRSLFGISAGQFVIRARLEKAVNLLNQSTMPISQIAQACGYGDQASFTRQFRKSVGVTPMAFRVAQKG